MFGFAGCMLCFGQSAFFRFNHPEEALRMKSMVPQGGSVSTGDYRLGPGTSPKPWLGQKSWTLNNLLLVPQIPHVLRTNVRSFAITSGLA